MAQLNSIKCVVMMKVKLLRNVVLFGQLEKYWLEKEYLVSKTIYAP